MVSVSQIQTESYNNPVLSEFESRKLEIIQIWQNK